MAVNKVILIGNVGKDPEVRCLDNTKGADAKVATFPLATSEKYTDRSGNQHEDTEWHSIVVWGKRAEVIEKFVKKGSQIYVEGKLKTRQWKDQQGNQRYTTEVICSDFQLVGRKENDNAPASKPAMPGSRPSMPASKPAMPAGVQELQQEFDLTPDLPY